MKAARAARPLAADAAAIAAVASAAAAAAKNAKLAAAEAASAPPAADATPGTRSDAQRTRKTEGEAGGAGTVKAAAGAPPPITTPPSTDRASAAAAVSAELSPPGVGQANSGSRTASPLRGTEAPSVNSDHDRRRPPTSRAMEEPPSGGYTRNDNRGRQCSSSRSRSCARSRHPPGYNQRTRSRGRGDSCERRCSDEHGEGHRRGDRRWQEDSQRRDDGPQHGNSRRRSESRGYSPPGKARGERAGRDASAPRRPAQRGGRSPSPKARKDRPSKFDEGRTSQASRAPSPKARSRPSKFSDAAGPVPQAVAAPALIAQQAAMPEIPTGPTLKVSSAWFKAIKIPASFVGHLIGPRGSRINEMRRMSGADIRIDHSHGNSYANITITGHTAEVAEKLILGQLSTAPGFTGTF